jgi:ParB/RepB/Spo0J family partition protein
MHKDVPLTEIVDNPFQPRADFDPATIRSLADEIQAEGFWNGSLQGRRNARGRVELVFGHRRLRALQLLKIPSARIEILDLTDAQMAMRALEENLQREGLTDFEKADAVRQAVELEKKRRRDNEEPEHGAVDTVAQRLGLAPQWVSSLRKISESIDSKEREQIDGAISAKTAHVAKIWGGKTYLDTLVTQARAAEKPDAKVSKPTENTVAAMKRAVNAAPETIREKLAEKVFAGDLATPEKVERAARSMTVQHARREKEPPPDLRAVIVGWTHDLKEWDQKLRDVLPYMDYVEEVPPIADRFRAALEKMITTAGRILKAAKQ